jgi:hypothetical protein
VVVPAGKYSSVEVVLENIGNWLNYGMAKRAIPFLLRTQRQHSALVEIAGFDYFYGKFGHGCL